MGYGQLAREAKEDRIFRMAEGDYKVRLLETKFGITNTQKKQVKLIFKVLEAPTQELMDKIEAKGRKIEAKFYPTVDYSFKTLLEFMLDAGCDLDSCDDTDVTDYKDLRKELSKLEEMALICKAKVKPQEGKPQYYNCYLNDVPNVYANSTAPTASVPAITREQMLAGGWTDELLRGNPTYAHLALPEAPTAPVATAPVPVATAPAPVATAPAPVATAPAPVATAPAPVATAPAPVATAPAPVATAPAPVATAPAPVATAVAPA